MVNPVREFVAELTSAFAGTLRFDADPLVDSQQQVDQAIADAGTVAGIVACLQPFPAADLFVLMPLHAKLALHIGRIKGFEVTPARAGLIVREVMSVAWLALTSQALIGIVGKAVPLVRPILTYPLNYAATWAIGQVVSYYFDCLKEGEAPSRSKMKEVFAKEMLIGRRRGNALDPVGIQERAIVLRSKIARRDPTLKTSVRLQSRAPHRPRSLARGVPRPTPRPGERIKIVIEGRPLSELREPDFDSAEPAVLASVGLETAGADSAAAESPGTEPVDPETAGLEPTVDEAPEPSVEAPEPAPLKTLGPQDTREVEVRFAPAKKTLGEAPPVRAKPRDVSPPPAPRRREGIAAFMKAHRTEAPKAPKTRGKRRPIDGLVRDLERLSELYEQGSLSEEEFKAAKARLLK
ncbi:MAG: SHOCT domain-containing protein [Planctomycetes bacterium]|nr:SHOCT domain-containing protein [Planctomycetota bacterium]